MSAADRPQVTVVGAGLMGVAIAYVFAAAGHPVWVQDPDRAALETLDGRLARIAGLCGAGRPLLARVRPCPGLREAAGDAALVIEAAPERKNLKKQIFAQLGALARTDAILASNTSSIPVGDLAAGVPYPGRVVGTHFWNPPYAVRLVEVVQGRESALPAVEAAMRLLRGVGMRPVHIKRDVPGIVGNRLQHALKREAIALIAAGVCDAETIDTVTKLGFGARMAVLGPMEQSDLVGLDLTLAIHTGLMPDLDRTPAAHPYLISKVQRGELGMRSGQGFRTWTPEQAQRVRDDFDAFLAIASQQGSQA